MKATLNEIYLPTYLLAGTVRILSCHIIAVAIVDIVYKALRRISPLLVIEGIKSLTKMKDFPN